MGKVEINMEVVNNEEVIKSKFLPDTVTRSVSISTLLVDNSATTLWLPKKVIEQLGLPMTKEVVVSKATGQYITNIFTIMY